MDSLTEMTRGEAADLIKRRIDAAAGTGSDRPVRSDSEQQQQKEQKQQQPVTQPSLPFFEIREEFDSDGREVKAEAVNVAKEMKALKDALRSHRDGQSKGANGGKEAKQICELIENLDIDAGESEIPQDIDDSTFTSAVEVVESHVETISDERYSSMSARLDELARLEEEAERNKNEGKNSRQRLQSKAWGKGFLSGSSKQAKKEKKKKNGGWNKGFLNAEPKSGKLSPASAEPRVANIEEPERERKVAFGENKIKEIPRIGQNSIKAAQLQKPATARREHAEPIATTAFSGVVMERPAKSSSSADSTSTRSSQADQVQQQHQQPKKKLSRFAQQRLEQRGGLSSP